MSFFDALMFHPASIAMRLPTPPSFRRRFHSGDSQRMSIIEDIDTSVEDSRQQRG